MATVSAREKQLLKKRGFRSEGEGQYQKKFKMPIGEGRWCRVRLHPWDENSSSASRKWWVDIDNWSEWRELGQSRGIQQAIKKGLKFCERVRKSGWPQQDPARGYKDIWR